MCLTTKSPRYPPSSKPGESPPLHCLRSGTNFESSSYATGLLTISTLGDLLPRRPLVLVLINISAALTIGLAVTSNLIVFEVLSFFIGVFSVTPQILMPLAADLAPPERRASALSIVLAGLLFGVLIARVLAGVVAQFVSWRVVYYISIAVQYAVLVSIYWLLPDYPAKNKGTTYFGILWSMAKFCVTEPLLMQAALINLPSSACFSNFWVRARVPPHGIERILFMFYCR